MNIYDSYSHIQCMKVTMQMKRKRCLPMKFSHYKYPHCCSVHSCQLFSLISAKRNSILCQIAFKNTKSFLFTENGAYDAYK